MLLLLVIFVLGKLPYPHCFLWNKIQMPKLKVVAFSKIGFMHFICNKCTN